VVIGYDHEGLDITDADAVESILVSQRPDVVINCAAWTDVDGCENHADKAWEANAYGPEILAWAALLANAAFITISTDYVSMVRRTAFTHSAISHDR